MNQRDDDFNGTAPGDDAVGEIPLSSALREAEVDSLTELMSRDPESYTRQDRNAMVAALREMRKKWELAEASGVKAKAAKPKVALSLSTKSNIDDLI